jgi:MoaA/NifB/PqqE/SkfB family radical SAM enzyme
MSVVKKDSPTYPARMGKKWDDKEVLTLLSSIKNKKSISDIAIEHQRTRGAINSERRKLATDYWFKDRRPIEEIITITGLTKKNIETIIKRCVENGFNITNNGTEELEVSSDRKDIPRKLSTEERKQQKSMKRAEFKEILEEIKHIWKNGSVEDKLYTYSMKNLIKLANNKQLYITPNIDKTELVSILKPVTNMDDLPIR